MLLYFLQMVGEVGGSNQKRRVLNKEIGDGVQENSTMILRKIRVS